MVKTSVSHSPCFTIHADCIIKFYVFDIEENWRLFKSKCTFVLEESIFYQRCGDRDEYINYPNLHESNLLQKWISLSIGNIFHFCLFDSWIPFFFKSCLVYCTFLYFPLNCCLISFPVVLITLIFPIYFVIYCSEITPSHSKVKFLLSSILSKEISIEVNQLNINEEF